MHSHEIARYLSRYFYIAVQDCMSEGCVIPETTITEADATYADVKKAIDNATWRVMKLYQVNLALGEVKDVTETVAIALWNECQAAGEPVDESVYVDFIRDHVPASFDCGYRGPECDDAEDARVVAMYPDLAAE